MIKRPLIWILGVYLLGIYLAWQKYSILIVIVTGLLMFLVHCIYLFKLNVKFQNSDDRFLWFLPILLVFGFLSMVEQMKFPLLFDAFEQEVSCEVSGKIEMIVQKQWGQALYVNNNVIFLADGTRYQCETIIVNCFDHQSYLVGNKINVQGTLQKFSKATNPGQFNEQLYYQIENIDFKMKADYIEITDTSYSSYHAVIDRIKRRFIEVYHRILPEKESGTLIAMLIGEKHLLNEEIKQLYQENGISHLLAISGLHITLIGMCIFQSLRKIRLGIFPSTLIATFFIYSYGVMTNFSVSTNRAVVMMVLLLFSTIVGKTYDMLSASAFSAFLILLQNPLQIFSAGFLLSFGAVFGLALVLPSLKNLFPQKNVILNGLFISVSAQIATTPLLLIYFYQLSAYSVFTNLMILPFITILTLASLCAGIAGAVYLPFGIFLIGGSNYILKLYEWICRWVSSLPRNMLTIGKPDTIKIVIYIMLVLFFTWSVKRYQKKAFLLVLLLAYFILLFPESHAGLEITVLDVGQGEAIFIQNERGTTFLIDGGSTDIAKVGCYRIQPFLKAKGIAKLDYMLMTHADYDHISGLTEIIEDEQIKIMNLILPAINKKDEAYIKFEDSARKKNIPVRYMKAEEGIQDGKLFLFCLHPAANDTFETTNAYSMVLSLRYGEFDMLLTGDLEQGGELPVMSLLQNPDVWKDSIARPALDYDVLKVPHHGSKYSTSVEFLNQLQPEVSLISCGKGNKYGHPHPELLQRLEQQDCDVKVTFESGAIRITTDGSKMSLKEYSKNHFN